MMSRRWRGFHPPAFYSLLTSFSIASASTSGVNAFAKLVSFSIISTIITSLQLYYTLYRVYNQVFILFFLQTKIEPTNIDLI
jgi:hypothetical protein